MYTVRSLRLGAKTMEKYLGNPSNKESRPREQEVNKCVASHVGKSHGYVSGHSSRYQGQGLAARVNARTAL